MFDRWNHPQIFAWRTMRAPLFGTALAAFSILAGCDGDSPSEPQNQAPTASFTSSCTDLDCTFSGSASSDSDGSIASYSWDFGDGGSGTGATANHTYAAAGSFEVRLTVTDNDGATNVLAQVVDVTEPTGNQSPTASFTPTCTDLDCSFDGSASSDPDGSISAWAWDFGDGNTGTGATATHSFAAAGTFSVSLTVTDDGAATDSTTQQVTVTAPASGISQVGANIVGEAAGDLFGHSVAISDDGTRVVAGATNNQGAASNSGHVRVFDWDGSAWTQVGQDIDGTLNQFIGPDRSVDISGDGTRVAIGSRRFSGGKGKTEVYELSGGSWTLVGSAIAASSQSAFGTSVSMSTDGNYVAIGARNGAGYVEVYAFMGSDWSLQGSRIAGTANDDTFGHDVAISGDGMRVMGAAPGGPGGMGLLRVYDWDGSAWTQVGADVVGTDNFGLNADMSVDGNRIVGYAAFSGDYAAVYELVGGAWVQMGADFAVPGAFDSAQNFSLSGTGSRLAVGNHGLGNVGSVQLFDWDGSSWTQFGSNVDGDHTGSLLGWSVSMSADGMHVAAGMIGFDNGAGGSTTGGVKVYTTN